MFDNPDMPMHSTPNAKLVDDKFRKLTADVKRLSSPSITVGERKRIADDLASLGVLLTSYAEEQRQTVDETEKTFEEALQREALWKGIEFTGAYPDYEAHHDGVVSPISIVEPYQLAYLDGKRVEGATPETIAKRLAEGKVRRKPTIMEDARHFSAVFNQACQIASSVAGQPNVKLIHVLAIVKAAYQTRKTTINETRLLEKSLGEGLVHLELHPGSDLRDAVPLRYEGIKRNVVWVKLARE